VTCGSWDRWRTVFEEAGYTTLAPDWPDDAATVEQANAQPGVFARKSVGQIADHFEAVIGQLDRKPAVIGHSFGGLLTQILAGRGAAAVSVAIDPAPFRGARRSTATRLPRTCSPRPPSSGRVDHRGPFDEVAKFEPTRWSAPKKLGLRPRGTCWIWCRQPVDSLSRLGPWRERLLGLDGGGERGH
jgi:pimeloyl-ACP methyl ester carboxylesterase